MSQQPSNCRLLALPRELRDTIYEYTFSDTEIATHDLTWRNRKSPANVNAGLVLANKQILTETYDLYYTRTEFVAFREYSLSHWLTKLPARGREHIRHLKFILIIANYESETIAFQGAEKVLKYRHPQLMRKLKGLGMPELDCVIELEMVPDEKVKEHRFGRQLEMLPMWWSG